MHIDKKETTNEEKLHTVLEVFIAIEVANEDISDERESLMHEVSKEPMLHLELTIAVAVGAAIPCMRTNWHMVQGAN